MLDILSSDDLRQLADTESDPCVSIFLPTHRAGPELAQDPTRLKNLLSRAEAELIALGMRSPEAERLLSPAAALLGDEAFWVHLEGGLAIFVTGEGMQTRRLPEPVDELVVVADRFHLKPLIPSMTTGAVAFVLALSQNQVRLFRMGRFSVSEVDGDDFPRSMAEALRWDDRERQVQSHAANRVGQGRVTATFHGHGAGKDALESDLPRFLRAVDDGVNRVVGKHDAPLVLAGVDHLVATYRKVSRHGWIIDESVEGNPERRTPSELHASAWPLVEGLFDNGRDEARARFLSGNAGTVDAPADAVVAAATGRIESLFVPVGVQVWGRFDPETMSVDVHDERKPGDRDLLDAAAIDTLTHSGRVFACTAAEVPGAGPVAGVLRF